MKKIIALLCTLLFTVYSYAVTYTYNQLLQSVMETGEHIELYIGDVIDFENGHTMTIEGEATECRAFGMTLQEMKDNVEKIEKRTRMNLV